MKLSILLAVFVVALSVDNVRSATKNVILRKFCTEKDVAFFLLTGCAQFDLAVIKEKGD